MQLLRKKFAWRLKDFFKNSFITAVRDIKRRFPLENQFLGCVKFLNSQVGLSINRPEELKSFQNIEGVNE